MGTRVLALRKTDHCVGCGAALEVGTRAHWDAFTRSVTCVDCADPALPASTAALAPDVETEAGGTSAQREFDRRHDARRTRVMTNHPKIGRVLLALVDDDASTKVWAQGAAGERAVAESIAKVEDGLFLNDRRMRRPDGRLSQANIDHIAVVPTGVWVIDAKTHKGRLEVRRTGGLLTPRTEQLRINGRDQSKLVAGVQRQVDVVRADLEAVGLDIKVRGALCFFGTEMPWIDEAIDGIPLRGRRGMKKLLESKGPFEPELRGRAHAYLAGRYPPA